MLSIKHVLLVLDTELENQNAIQRAMQICQEQSAQLFITAYVYNHACEEGSLVDLELRHDLKSLLINETQDWAEALIKEYYLSADTPLSIIWCKHAYQAVNDNSAENSFDLVIKAAAKHHSIVDRVMQHQDWNLLKYSPAPLLLVKNKQAWESRCLLAAIDATSLDGAHKIINEHIFEFAELINKDNNYQTHLCNSYPVMSLTLASLPDAPIPEDLQIYIENQHVEACDQIARRYNIEQENRHIKEGEPAEVICQNAATLDADVVLVGIVNQDNMQSVILGSTLEQVLDNTKSDVLAIKPQDGVLSLAEEEYENEFLDDD